MILAINNNKIYENKLANFIRLINKMKNVTFTKVNYGNECNRSNTVKSTYCTL